MAGMDSKLDSIVNQINTMEKPKAEMSETLQMEFDELRQEVKEIKSLLLNKAPQANSESAAINQFVMMNKNLQTLIERKDTQIENQGKFEKAWRRTKMLALAAIVLSSIFGIIDVKEDSGVIADRTVRIIDSLAQAMK